MKVLVTGFTSFPGVAVNPTQLIVEHLQDTPPEGVDLVNEVLPTAFQTAGRRIGELIQRHRPDAVLCLGVAQKRDAINLERIARNWDEATIPDNNGVQLSGCAIVPDAPEQYFSTLPLEHMKTRLDAVNIETVFSASAGTYVCNHVFYCARHEIEQMGKNIPCGFVHVPGLAGTGEFPGWELGRLIKAVECCLEGLSTGVNFPQ